MLATVLANVEHARSTQVADDTPHRAMREVKDFAEVVYSAALACCDTEQHGTVAGDMVPAVTGTGRELQLPHVAPPNLFHASRIIRTYTKLGAGVKRGSGCGG